MIRRAIRRALATPPPALRDVPEGALVVVMAQWRRPERLERTLRDLAVQDLGRPIVLVVWNNHPLTQRLLRRQAAAGAPSGALAEVRLLRSRANLGGLARFVVMRHLRDAGRRGPVVTVDDDMALEPSALRTLVEAWSPRTFAGAWAWRIDGDDYWQRTMPEGGEPVDYVGTGGALVDIDIVAGDAFFDRLPDRFVAVEDLWASRWAAADGWRLVRVDAPVRFEDDEHGQHQGLGDRKRELWRVADALVRGERVAVEADPTGGLVRVGVRERLRARIGQARRVLARAARTRG